VTGQSASNRRPAAFRQRPDEKRDVRDRPWDYSVRERRALSSSPLEVMLSRLSLLGPMRAPYRLEPHPSGAPTPLPAPGLPLVRFAALQSVDMRQASGGIGFSTPVVSSPFLTGLTVFTRRRPPLSCENGFILSELHASTEFSASCLPRTFRPRAPSMGLPRSTVPSTSMSRAEP
jgi:hypothetical protein